MLGEVLKKASVKKTVFCNVMQRTTAVQKNVLPRSFGGKSKPNKQPALNKQLTRQLILQP
jgi:hypothetical protein